MLKGKLDLKGLLILILGGILVFNIMFDESKEIDDYKEQIELLKKENLELLNNNDSLQVVNQKLAKEIENLLMNIDSTQAKVKSLEGKIKDLENEKGQVTDYVNGLNADGVASSLTDYLNRRK